MEKKAVLKHFKPVSFNLGDLKVTTDCVAYGQPVQALDGSIPYIEFLARKRSASVRGEIETPDKFFSDIDPIKHPEIDFHILDQACYFIAYHQDRGVDLEDIPKIGVNFHPRTLSDPLAFEKINKISSSYGVPPEMLTIEVLEQSFQKYENDEIDQNLLNLSNQGYFLAIDDYGTIEKDEMRSLTPDEDRAEYFKARFQASGNIILKIALKCPREKLTPRLYQGFQSVIFEGERWTKDDNYKMKDSLFQNNNVSKPLPLKELSEKLYPKLGRQKNNGPSTKGPLNKISYVMP